MASDVESDAEHRDTRTQEDDDANVLESRTREDDAKVLESLRDGIKSQLAANRKRVVELEQELAARFATEAIKRHGGDVVAAAASAGSGMSGASASDDPMAYLLFKARARILEATAFRRSGDCVKPDLDLEPAAAGGAVA